MNILSEKTVITRKPHRCDACERKFEAGIKMNVQDLTDEGDFWRYRTCPTCTELLKTHSKHFDDGYGEFPAGVVEEACYKNQTPEELLIHLSTKDNPPRAGEK